MQGKCLAIIPAYNEAKNIPHVINDLTRMRLPWLDYLIVNDCSSDNTIELCKTNSYSFISLPYNLGIGGAVQAGFRYAYEKGYDFALQFDGDGQHLATCIPDLVKPLKSGIADMTVGSRFLEYRGFQSYKMRKIGIKLLSSFIFLRSGRRIKDVTSGFRAVNRYVMESFVRSYPNDYPEPESLIYVILNGCNVLEVPVEMRERSSGTSSITLWRAVYYMIKVSLAILICGRRKQ